MVPSNFTYSVRECAHHFSRNFATVLGAIVTIFLSLFIIGMFALGSAMIENLVGTVEDQVTIQAYLSDDAEQADVDAFQAELESWDNVASVAYKSKDEALEEYRTSMSDRNAADAVAALDGENPLPASLVVTMTDPQEVEVVADKIVASTSFHAICDTPDDPTSDVRYGAETVEKLFSVTKYLRIGMFVLVALLVFVAFVFINNTIRLSITARRREIAIMRLVGASNGYIRGPFLMEGTIEGILGALLAVGALAGGMSVLLPTLSESLSFLTFEISDTIVFGTYGILLVIGIILGFFSSAIAMGRYLKV